MNYSEIVREKIATYNVKGNLDQTSKIFLNSVILRHPLVKVHCERVAILAEAIAIELGKDVKATFFAGLLHDYGKMLLPENLFTGRNINPEEYALVKEHARNSFLALRESHLFIALASGAHHAVYKKGYGITSEDFPEKLGLGTIKKILEISTIVSVCDFIDAFLHRKTAILDGSGTSPDLRQMLLDKYPNDQNVIEIALKNSNLIAS